MIDSLKPYAFLKPGGVTWLDTIPAHWQMRKLRHCGAIVGGMTPSMAEPAFWGGNVPWITPKDMKTPILGDSQMRVTGQAIHVTSLRVLPPGAVLLVVRGMILARRVPVARTTVPTTINQDMKAIVPTGAVDPAFLAAALESAQQVLAPLIDEAGHGTKRFPTERWREVVLPFPPPEEQAAIVRFLDHADRRIRKYIAAKRKLIALLNEQKQAIIHRAITRGLDPNVRLKPSGTDWLGDIPEHWQVMRIKHVAKMESGHTPSRSVPEHWLETNDIPWVSLNDTKALDASDYISDTKFRINELGLKNSSARMLPQGVVVFTRDATVGKAAITTRRMAVSQHLIAWVCGPRIKNEYLLRVFYAMQAELSRFTFGATIATIGMDDVRKLTTPVPPIKEQARIVEYVANACASVDKAIELGRCGVRALDEFRTRLIAAVVTGRIDVRAVCIPRKPEDASQLDEQDLGDLDETPGELPEPEEAVA